MTRNLVDGWSSGMGRLKPISLADIDNESISLLQGDQLLGQYPLDEVHFLRWSGRRIILNLAGESANFYPLRPDEFTATLHRYPTPIRRYNPAGELGSGSHPGLIGED